MPTQHSWSRQMMRFLFLIILFLVVLARLTPAKADDIPRLFIDPGGHTSIVRQAVFTPDGKNIISVGNDKSIRVWDVTTGKEIGVIYGQVADDNTGQLLCASLSPITNADGTRTLAVAGVTNIGAITDNVTSNRFVIRLFHLGNLSSRPLAATLDKLLPATSQTLGHGDVILQLAFSPDGRFLASSSNDTTVRVWNVATGGCVILGGRGIFDPNHTYDNEHSNAVDCVAWSPRGDKVASGSLDGTIRIWDPDSLDGSDRIGDSPHGLCVKKLDVGGQVKCLAWSQSDSHTLVAGTISDDLQGGDIDYWDTTSFSRKNTLSSEDKPVSCIAISPDGKMIASGQDTGKSGNCEVRVWSLASDGHYRQSNPFTQHQSAISSVAFSPSGTTVASADISGNIYLWSPGSASVVQKLAGSGEETTDTAWAQDGKYLRWKSGSQEYFFDFAHALCASVQSPSLPQTTWLGAVQTITTKAGEDLKIIPGPEPYIVTVQKDGHGVSSFPRPYNKDTDPDSYRLNAVNCTTFTPDGTGVIVGSNFHLKLFSADGGQELRDFIGHTAPIRSVSVSPDGVYLASTSYDQTVRIWNLKSGDTAPLISIFASSDPDNPAELRYVAWGPRGYYACSPNGQNIIGWQRNQGDDKRAGFDPASSLPILRRSDLISALWKTGDIISAMAQAGVSDDIGDLKPPTVDQLNLKDGQQIDSQDLDVSATITPGSHPLAEIDFSVDGVPYVDKLTDAADAVASKQPLVRHHLVHLRKGKRNVVTVTAYDVKQNHNFAGATVVCTLPKATGKPTLNLLAIGVKTYEKFLNLRYPDRDAIQLAATLKMQEGKVFSKVNASVLVNKNATKQNIMDKIDALVQTAPSDDDYTIVFVAGHGGQTDSLHYYLLPYDVDTSVDAATVDKTAINWNDIYQKLRTLHGHVFLFLDACHSAGATSEAEQQRNDEQAAANSEGYNNFTATMTNDAQSGTSPLITFASCGPGELSEESTDWQHGAFTKALIEALQPDGNLAVAAGANQQDVQLQDLNRFVQEEVYKLTAGKQRPMPLGNFTNDVNALPFAQINSTATKTASR